MKHQEASEQRAVFKWIDMHKNKHPGLRMAFSVKNEGKKRILSAVRDKEQGVRSGVPDIIILHPHGGFHGLAIELKREDGGTVSENQKRWIKALNEEGYKAVICHGADEAIETLKGYLL